MTLLQRLCLAIRDDLRQRGPDPQLMLLGAGLDYCASLLADAGADDTGDGADAALAQLELELLALSSSLRAARHRGDGAERVAAAELLRALFPTGALPDSLTAARLMQRAAQGPEVQRALDRLGLRGSLRLVEQALDEAERWIARCQGTPASELRLRARAATRMADALLRRVLGHVTAATDTADPEQRVRAASLLFPLLEELEPPRATGSSLAADSRLQ